MAGRLSTPYYTGHSRFKKQDVWHLCDLSVSLSGSVVACGYNKNTSRTYIDVYHVSSADFGETRTPSYTKQSEPYSVGRITYNISAVSFVHYAGENIATCIGDKLEVLQGNNGDVLQSRKVNGTTRCLSVKGREIFIGFSRPAKITVYDVINLNKIKSIILQGLRYGDHPSDITPVGFTTVMFVSIENRLTREDKPLMYEEKSGKIAFELTDPTGTHSNAWSTTVNASLRVAAAVWSTSFAEVEKGFNKIILYSLLSEKKSSFLIVEVDPGVYKIGMSNIGDKMFTGNFRTGEVKVFDMAELFTYNHFKEKLTLTLQTDDCEKLANFFELPKDQTNAILNSDSPSESLLFALEEKGILQPYNVYGLTKAFEELSIDPFCGHMTEIFMKTRSFAISKEIIKPLSEEMKMVRLTHEEEMRPVKKNPSNNPEAKWESQHTSSVTSGSLNDLTRLDGKFWGGNVRRVMGVLQLMFGGIECALSVVFIFFSNCFFYDKKGYVGWAVPSVVFAMVSGLLGVYSVKKRCMIWTYMMASIINVVLCVDGLVYVLIRCIANGWYVSCNSFDLAMHISLCTVLFIQVIISTIGASFSCVAVGFTKNQPQQAVKCTPLPLSQQPDPAPPYAGDASKSGLAYQINTPRASGTSEVPRIQLSV